MILSLQQCPKRFEFEHVYQIRPKQYPEAMTRGIEGHELMEAFFIQMRNGGTYDECVEAVNLVLPQFIGRPGQAVYRHILAFGAYVFQQGWKVIEVEQSRMFPLGIYVNRLGVTEELEFAYTPDLMLEWTSGPKKGSRFMLDFKFTGQYWTDKEIGVYQQLPKYVLYWNKSNPDEKPVKHAALAMLNTRASAGATGQNLFMLKWLNLRPAKLDIIENENLIMSQKAAEARILGELYPPGSQERRDIFTRNVNTYGCKMCIFGEDLCPMDLEGRDITKTMDRNYIHNTYFDDNYGVDSDA
jgi:hypothetical protein